MSRSFVVPTRNVVLTASEASLVDRLIRSGRYLNAAEVLREGLRLLERREQKVSTKLVTLRGATDKAQNASPAGDVHGTDETFLDEIERQA